MSHSNALAIADARGWLILGCCFGLPLAPLESAEPNGTLGPPPTERDASFLASQTIEADSEVLWTSDLKLTDHSAGYRQVRAKSEINLTFSYSTIDLAYEPADFDIISEPKDLNEGRLSFQSGLKHKVAPSLTLLGSGGLYDGYGNYRTLWLSEYYRQYYSEAQGYKQTDPGGYNASAGLRWEYLPASGFIQVDALYSRDDIPSGYEVAVRPAPPIGTDLLRSSDRLHTAGGRVILENVLTRRLRSLNEFQIADTTDREPRLSYQGSLNWAIAEEWVLRLMLGLSREEPNFHSVSGSATLEHDWKEKWFVSLFARYYKDNGEIDNPQLFNVAAPSLDTIQIGAGFRWLGERWSARFVAGPYFTRYAPVEADIKPFEKLYRNRDWVMAQASVSLSF